MITELEQIESAIKNPEGVTESQDEVRTRERAEQLYYQSGGRQHSGLSGYQAGWIAAKAHAENHDRKERADHVHA
jgi:hypothetical protein